jgi:hypothetical protein
MQFGKPRSEGLNAYNINASKKRLVNAVLAFGSELSIDYQEQ